VLATLAGAPDSGWPAVLLAQPGAWTVPCAFLTMIGVSLASRREVPADVGHIMLQLHAPEALGLGRPG
jgi:hypothetical protein